MILRRHSSTSVIETEREKTLYAVFVSLSYGIEEDGYTIYKLDSSVQEEGSSAAACKGDADKLFKPIKTLKSSDYPRCMFIFSVGTKIYFCGGFEIDPADDSFPLYTRKAYMFDLNDDDRCIVSSIESMNFPKRSPLLFGPVDDYKYYAFSVSSYGTNFEMLNTITNQWKTLPIPPHFTPPLGHPPSALCGSNILILPRSSGPIYVFCTRSEVWRVINHVPDLFTNVPHPLPFRNSVPLFRGNRDCHIFLASYGFQEVPSVYTSPNMSMSLDVTSSFEPVAPFEYSGEVENLREHIKEMPEFLGHWPTMRYFFSLNDNCVCFVFTDAPGISSDLRYVISICDFSYNLMEGTHVKVKVENFATYEYRNKRLMMPRHIFAV